MRPLTDSLPKPLLEVNEKPLIVYHVEKLAEAGFSEVVINIAHLGYKIPETLGDGSAWNIKISYSDEQEQGALESAGGIIKALPLLGDKPFLVVNGDVFCEYTFDSSFELKKDDLAHLILVGNPEHNLDGDFALTTLGVQNEGKPKFTFSGIGYYSPKLFEGLEVERLPLAPLLREAITKGKVSGELYSGEWHDIGTPQRLESINNRF